MKVAFGCGSTFLFFLAIIILAIPLACIFTVAVPFFDRQILQEIACPPGTTLVTEWIETTYTRPGEKVLSAYCVDKDGNESAAQDLGYGALKYFPKYYEISLGVTFVLSLLILTPLVIIFRLIRKKSSPEEAATPPSTIKYL